MTALPTGRPISRLTAARQPRTADWRRRIQGEPSLADLLDDPCLALLLHSDGLSRDDLQRVIAGAQSGLRRGLCRCAA